MGGLLAHKVVTGSSVSEAHLLAITGFLDPTLMDHSSQSQLNLICRFEMENGRRIIAGFSIKALWKDQSTIVSCDSQTI